MNGDYIVFVLTVFNLFAALAYSTQGDWARVVYWLGAFILTGSTLFIGR